MNMSAKPFFLGHRKNSQIGWGQRILEAVETQSRRKATRKRVTHILETRRLNLRVQICPFKNLLSGHACHNTIRQSRQLSYIILVDKLITHP